MATTLNKISGLVVSQYGTPIELQIVGSDGIAEDMSAYTGITVVTVSENAQVVKSFTGSFSTTGTDGKIIFTPSSSNTFDRQGTWQGQVEFSDTGALVLTVPFEVIVEPKLGS